MLVLSAQHLQSSLGIKSCLAEAAIIDRATAPLPESPLV